MTGAELRIGVVLEAFLDWPLEEVLPWLRQAAPEITDIEVGAGGYAPHPHCDVITEVAARGLPILCEKPCGLTVAQTQAAVAATQAAGVAFQVAYWRRYVAPLRALRQRIAAGELGAIHLVACYQWDDQPPSDEFRAHSGRRDLGGTGPVGTRCRGDRGCALIQGVADP